MPSFPNPAGANPSASDAADRAACADRLRELIDDEFQPRLAGAAALLETFGQPGFERQMCDRMREDEAVAAVFDAGCRDRSDPRWRALSDELRRDPEQIETLPPRLRMLLVDDTPSLRQDAIVVDAALGRWLASGDAIPLASVKLPPPSEATTAAAKPAPLADRLLVWVGYALLIVVPAVLGVISAKNEAGPRPAPSRKLQPHPILMQLKPLNPDFFTWRGPLPDALPPGTPARAGMLARVTSEFTPITDRLPTARRPRLPIGGYLGTGDVFVVAAVANGFVGFEVRTKLPDEIAKALSEPNEVVVEGPFWVPRDHVELFDPEQPPSGDATSNPE